MPVWPPTLPQEFLRGITDQRAPAVTRFVVDAGPAMVRRSHGNPKRQIEDPILFRNDQRITFDEFFVETLFEGALAFDWLDPVTGVTKSFRFLSPPTFQGQGGDGGPIWTASMSLELLP